MSKSSPYSVFNQRSTTSSLTSNSSNNTPTDLTTPKTTTSFSVVATEDGFSFNEIAQFAQLLSSPKKAPPSRYQCHICYKTGHYISDCPLVIVLVEFSLKNVFYLKKKLEHQRNVNLKKLKLFGLKVFFLF